MNKEDPSKDGRFPVQFIFTSRDGKKETVILKVKHDRRDVLSFDASALQGGTVTVTAEAIEGEPSIMVGKSKLKLVRSPGSFAVNYIKHLLIMLAQMTLFAAVALGFGSLFTFPVAIFGTLCMFLAANIRGFSESLKTTTVVKGLYYLIYVFVPNFAKYDTMEHLTEGIAIPWTYLGYTWGGITLVKGLIIFGICYFFFRNREIGA